MSKTKNVKRLVTRAELIKQGYEDMAELSVMFNHNIVEMDNGTWRWEPNALMCLLLDSPPVMIGANKDLIGGTNTRARLDLNQLAIDLFEHKYTVEEKMKYMMQIGYSLCGFSELFHQHEATEYDLPGAKTTNKNVLHNNGYIETVIQYMLRVHKGKVLKL